MKDKVKRTERGWAGHFCCASLCRFRRNTLLEYGDMKLVVSTVGMMIDRTSNQPEPIGVSRYYETMVFMADDSDFHDSDVTKQVSFTARWTIDEPYRDIEANEMHESIVDEMCDRMTNNDIKMEYED